MKKLTHIVLSIDSEECEPQNAHTTHPIDLGCEVIEFGANSPYKRQARLEKVRKLSVKLGYDWAP